MPGLRVGLPRTVAVHYCCSNRINDWLTSPMCFVTSVDKHMNWLCNECARDTFLEEYICVRIQVGVQKFSCMYVSPCTCVFLDFRINILYSFIFASLILSKFLIIKTYETFNSPVTIYGHEFGITIRNTAKFPTGSFPFCSWFLSHNLSNNRTNSFRRISKIQPHSSVHKKHLTFNIFISKLLPHALLYDITQICTVPYTLLSLSVISC